MAGKMKSSNKYGSHVQHYKLANGDLTYYIVFKHRRQIVREKVGRKSEGYTEKICNDHRKRRISELKHGRNLLEKAEANKVTFDDLAVRFFEYGAVHNRSNDKSRMQYEKHIKPVLGDKVFYQLLDSDIRSLQASKTQQNLKPATVDALVKLIKRVVSHNIKEGVVEYSPFKNIKMLDADNDRERYLTLDEIDELVKAVSDKPMLLLFVRIAMSTGARAESVLNIRVKDVNISQRTVTLKDFKRNNTYTGFLDDAAMDAITKHSRMQHANSHIISAGGKALTYNALYRRMKPILDRFNIGLDRKDSKNRVVIHTLRHTFASHLAINGTPIHTIQKLMNHSDISMTQKYSHLSPDSGRDNVNNLYKGAA